MRISTFEFREWLQQKTKSETYCSWGKSRSVFVQIGMNEESRTCCATARYNDKRIAIRLIKVLITLILMETLCTNAFGYYMFPENSAGIIRFENKYFMSFNKSII